MIITSNNITCEFKIEVFDDFIKYWSYWTYETTYEQALIRVGIIKSFPHNINKIFRIRKYTTFDTIVYDETDQL